MNRLPPVADAVPHAPPMLALDELVDWAPGRIVCRLVVREGGPFVDAAGVDGVWTLEYMGQAVAACCGCEALRAGSRIRVGVIVACRSMSIERALVPLGTELVVAARCVRSSQAASLFETEVRDADGLVARAVMTVVHRDGAAAGPAQV